MKDNLKICRKTKIEMANKIVKINDLYYLGHCTLGLTRRLSNFISNQVPVDSQTSEASANPGKPL